MVSAKRLHGILLVDKPPGLTSAAVVGKIKRTFGLKKVGHAGTLDPVATGLLPICINEGTKLAGFLSESVKEYAVSMRLGVETDSYDRMGVVLREAEVPADRQHILAELHAFLGRFEQTPPVFSAKKVDGRPAYKAARAGREVDLKPVPVEVFAISNAVLESPDLHFDVRASKGFYIRSLCHDLGAALGCGGHMLELRRTGHSGFSVSEAHPLDEILSGGEAFLEKILLSPESERIPLPVIRIPEEAERDLAHGRPFPPERIPGWESFPDAVREARAVRAVGPSGRLRALLSFRRADEGPGPAMTILRGFHYAED